MKRALACLALALAACGGAANTDPLAMVKYREKQAVEAYPAVPSAADGAKMRDQGQPIFRAAGCEVCHSTARDRKGMTGPPLGGISERMLAEHNNDPLEGRRWLYKHIRDPGRFPGQHAGKSEYSGAFMPPNDRLKDDELRALIEFLWHLP